MWAAAVVYFAVLSFSEVDPILVLQGIPAWVALLERLHSDLQGQ